VGVWEAQVRYQLVNRAFERWRGRSRGDAIGLTLEQVVGPDDYELMRPWVQRALAGETVSYEKEIRSEREARLALITYVPRRREDGTVDGFIGVAQDITPHRDERTRLLALAERDPLTGLLNRAGFDGWLSRQTAAGEGATTAVLYIDLDRFKPVNDTHGHAVGDEVLAMFAARLQRLVRPTDAVARLGGDEFAIVLSGVTELGPVQAVARKVVEAAAQPFEIGDLRLSIGASVGAALDATGEGGWKALVARADALSYQAKAQRRQHEGNLAQGEFRDRASPPA
jgi:diguanylate cyclase (GGDEF)-like protein/PAS domain S-box-containing protein